MSVKTKTIILVFILFILSAALFFFVRYKDVKDFAALMQQSEKKRVEIVYSQTIKRVKKFYITRGYANINSYGIREAFEKNDKKALYDLSLPRWQIISKENRYLTSFCFYDEKGRLLTYFGKFPEKKLSYFKKMKKPYSGFWYDENEGFMYHAVSEARDKKGNIVGYVVFVINPKYFLEQIRSIMDVNIYMLYKNGKHTITFSLGNTRYINYLKYDNNPIKIKEIKIDNKIFLPYIVNGKGMDKSNNFKIIFLQDITYSKTLIHKAIIQSIIAVILFMLVVAIAINYGFDIILKELNESNQKLKNSQDELKELNKNLRKRVEKEIELKLKKEREANEKERILSHQSKLASMGEMIGNIAHQWRQPLTALSSILINIELFFEKGKLTKEKLSNKINEANEQINFMSKTIDDFRNFFSSGKQKEIFNVSVPIKKVENLMSASLSNNDIKLCINIKDNFKLFVYPNEIAQALLNLVSNAKDVILERGIKNGYIKISTFIKDDKQIISIKDNAGGIKASPIEKIYEPYFSTKHATSGTGIGLYMTKTIIEKNNNGKIFVSNNDNGAVFMIAFKKYSLQVGKSEK